MLNTTHQDWVSLWMARVQPPEQSSQSASVVNGELHLAGNLRLVLAVFGTIASVLGAAEWNLRDVRPVSHGTDEGWVNEQ